MFKLLPTLLSLAFLLVLTTACNRDAVDSTGDGTGTFLAPASAPLNPNARAAEDEARQQMAPTLEEPDVLPGEDEPSVGQMTAEEIDAAKRAGPGRVGAQPQTAVPRTAAPEKPKTMAAPNTGGKPALDYDRPVVSVSKSACYGKCRQFVLTLTNDRRLILEAGANMDRKGKYSRRLNAREYNELLVAMQAADPEGLTPLYPNNVKQIPADAQGTVLRFPDLNGDERKVEIYYDAPEKLTEFLTAFEAWVDKDGWIKTAE
jgi:hypothetical protein